MLAPGIPTFSRCAQHTPARKMARACPPTIDNAAELVQSDSVAVKAKEPQFSFLGVGSLIFAVPIVFFIVIHVRYVAT